jgi:hypothetical protein
MPACACSSGTAKLTSSPPPPPTSSVAEWTARTGTGDNGASVRAVVGWSGAYLATTAT